MSGSNASSPLSMQNYWVEAGLLLWLVLPDSLAPPSIVAFGVFINAPFLRSESVKQGPAGKSRSNTIPTSSKPWRF